MAKLCVNVDHVATVRQARMIATPDPLEAALLAEKAGAVGITIHLREDRRHIQDADVRRIKRAISAKLNLEMAATEEIIRIALKTKPDQVSLVPERRREVTTEGGLNLTRNGKKWRSVIERFAKKKIVVSLFIDPDGDQIEAALRYGAEAIELNTGAYAEATTKGAIKKELRRLQAAAALAESRGLTCHAGHGLNLQNVGPVAAIPTIDELNIGHSIVGRAIMVGFGEAVREMQAAINAT